MESQKMETSDICAELEKLARSDVFARHTADACIQAALLLRNLRPLIFESPGMPRPDGTPVEKMKWLLSQQGDG